MPNKVTDFGRVLLPAGRRVAEKFFSVSKFFSQMSQLRLQPAVFTANHETAVFEPANRSGTKLLRD
jgi:hypothetical protein